MLVPRRTSLVVLAAAACLIPAPAVGGTEDEVVRTALDRVQDEIAVHKQTKAADVAALTGLFERLARRYLQALGPHVRRGGEFSIAEQESWDEPGGPKGRFKRRIERDMRQWHPAFSLAFVEEVLGWPDWGTYAVMLDLPGQTIADAVRLRKEERALELQQAGYGEAAARSLGDREIAREAARQWEVLNEVLEENLVRILVEGLEVDPISTRLNVVARVAGILELIADDGRYRDLDERVRQGAGSDTLPETIHEIAGGVLARQTLDATLKERRFRQLLGLFVLLQNRASLDHLLLLFGGFDDYDDLLGTTAPRFDQTLNVAVAAFALASLGREPPGELGFDLVDQLTRWIVTRVALDGYGLRQERIIDVLLLLRDERPQLMEEYVLRFYRDFHAFNPAGYETVIFQLVSILVTYAETGVLVEPDPIVGSRQAAPGTNSAPPTHEKVMDVLRWYDSALERLAPFLPRIDLDRVEEEQRAVLERILGYFEAHLDDLRPRSRRSSARFIETMLQLVKRIAIAARPGDIQERVLRPFARARGFDEDPLLFWSDRRVSGTMEIYLGELAAIVAARPGR